MIRVRQTSGIGANAFTTSALLRVPRRQRPDATPPQIMGRRRNPGKDGEDTRRRRVGDRPDAFGSSSSGTRAGRGELSPRGSGSPRSYGVFSTGDDTVIALAPAYVPLSTEVHLSRSPARRWPPAAIVSSSRAQDGLADLAGNRLDGDGDGIAGGDYVHTFSVITLNTPPTALPGAAFVDEGRFRRDHPAAGQRSRSGRAGLRDCLWPGAGRDRGVRCSRPARSSTGWPRTTQGSGHDPLCRRRRGRSPLRKRTSRSRCSPVNDRPTLAGPAAVAAIAGQDVVVALTLADLETPLADLVVSIEGRYGERDGDDQRAVADLPAPIPASSGGRRRDAARDRHRPARRHGRPAEPAADHRLRREPAQPRAGDSADRRPVRRRGRRARGARSSRSIRRGRA